MPTVRKIASPDAGTKDEGRRTKERAVIPPLAADAHPSAMAQQDLPAGWTWTTLEDVCQVERGVTFPASAKSDHLSNGYIACMRTANIQISVDWDDLIYVPKSYVKSADKLLRPHDILISMANSRQLVGKVSFVDHIHSESTFGGFIAAIRALEPVDSRFLFYYLRLDQSQERLRSGSSQTVNIANISLGGIYVVEIPLPPLAEQRRIVAAIEQQITRLDAGVASLRRAQAGLRRYRAAVLKAACEGRLVPQDPGDEPADALMRRILDERRAKWEAEQIARTQAQGRMLLDDGWRAKYQDPQGPDTAGLPELPSGWMWVRFDQLLTELKNGYFGGAPAPEPPGMPILRINAVRSLRVNLNDCRFLPNVEVESVEEHRLRDGDLLFTRYNGSLELVGVCGVVKGLHDTMLYPDKLIRARVPNNAVLPEYLEIYFATEIPRRRIELRVKTTAGQQGIAGGEIKTLPVALPPLAEQQRIVAEVERRLSVVAEVEAAVAANLKRAERLRQAILKRAFEGKLAPQDPSDEPASALLERIRTQRAGQGEKKSVKQERMEGM